MPHAIQTRVLDAALALCRERGGWTFEVAEIVTALPDLNPQSVRTHVTSRCCVNAPAHHAHRWPYFRRVGRGRYEVLPSHRKLDEPRVLVAREAQPVYTPAPAARDLVHAVVSRSDAWFVAEVLELPVVTQGRSLDETVANLRDAIALHLSGGDRARLGIADHARLAVSYETRLEQ